MMDKRNWKILYSKYEGIQKKAIELVSAEVGSIICRDKGVFTLHVLGCEKFGAEIDRNIIAIGKYEENPIAQSFINKEEIPENGYFVRVFDNPDNEELKIVVITAHDDVNVFYGAIDFTDNYLPEATPYRSNALRKRDETFNDKIPDYIKKSSPKATIRSIFTWGQPINDFRRYIENAARLKFNRIIIWNDFLPINSEDIVDYAHEYGIEIFWGFAWGWTTDCNVTDLNNLNEMKKSVVDNFKKTYLNAKGDGIYFQSFTETDLENKDGIIIADAVTGFVNSVAEEVFKLSPDIKIQFGLHASSVKNNLEFLEKVDERIEIVWEDCGCFPYHYRPETATPEAFEETLEFTEKIIALRNYGQTGLVYKGMMTMDWYNFVHQAGPYIMGKSADELIKNDIEMLTPMWRYIQTLWLQKAGKYAWEFTRRIYEMVKGDIEVNLAGTLEGGIWYPYALCAELMWNAEENFEVIEKRVLNRPWVKLV